MIIKLVFDHIASEFLDIETSEVSVVLLGLISNHEDMSKSSRFFNRTAKHSKDSHRMQQGE